jgi:hypothetical protein
MSQHGVPRALLLAASTLAFAGVPLPGADEPGVEPGFTSLFDGKDIGRHFISKGDPARWKVVDGLIVSTPGGDRLMSKERFGDFVLRLDFKVSKNGNSGVFFRVPAADDAAPWVTGFEAQISNEPRDDEHCTGSLYGVQAVKPRPDETHDVWHAYEIACLGKRVEVRVDGVLCVEADYEKNERMRSRPLEGYIGLQDSHAGPGSTIAYRRVRIQRLAPDGTIPGFTPLTRDGRGWRTIKSGHGSGGRWAFQDGAWSGEQDPPGSGNGGVNATEALFGDFELVAEVKIDWGCDSGIFLRSTDEGRCYQILVDHLEGGNVGGIYGEGTGGFSFRNYDFKADGAVSIEKQVGGAPPLGDEASKGWRRSAFNEVRARIRGNPPVIEVWLNGLHLGRFADSEVRIPERGRIGLQVHGGGRWPPGARVHYRNLQVRALERVAAAGG